MKMSETILKGLKSINGISLMERSKSDEISQINELIDCTYGLVKLCGKILDDDCLNLNEYYEGKFILLSSYLKTLLNELRINGNPKRLAISYYLVGLLECLRYDLI